MMNTIKDFFQLVGRIKLYNAQRKSFKIMIVYSLITQTDNHSPINR